MAILVEGMSVIIRINRLMECFGNWEAFVAIVPNKTLCFDEGLARVGFLSRDEVKRFVGGLEQRGLRYIVEGKASDLVVADQQYGLLIPCEWALFGRVDLNGDPRQRVGACMMDGGDPDILITPDDWEYHGSLSASFCFVSDGGLPLMKRRIDTNGREILESPLASMQFHGERIATGDEQGGEKPISSSGMVFGTWGQA